MQIQAVDYVEDRGLPTSSVRMDRYFQGDPFLANLLINTSHSMFRSFTGCLGVVQIAKFVADFTNLAIFNWTKFVDMSLEQFLDALIGPSEKMTSVS